jgi:hypothetical protein
MPRALVLPVTWLPLHQSESSIYNELAIHVMVPLNQLSMLHIGSADVYAVFVSWLCLAGLVHSFAFAHLHVVYSITCLERPHPKPQKCGLSRQVASHRRYYLVKYGGVGYVNFGLSLEGGLSSESPLKTGFSVHVLRGHLQISHFAKIGCCLVMLGNLWLWYTLLEAAVWSC